MFKKILISIMLAVSFSMTASATDWSELIGKQLVLYRWGKIQDRWFSEYHPINTMGKEPIENIVLSDATHVEWNNTQQGSFARECTIQGSVLTFNEGIFGNEHLRILECDGEVLLTLGEDSLTRAFFIQTPKLEPSQLPASVNSKKGFCNGKLDNLLPSVTDITYSSRTPMGHHFLYNRQASQEEKAWLESTKEAFDDSKSQSKAYDVNLFPHDKPVQADVHKNGVVLSNAGLVLKDMAILYPEFIKSIIHQEAADSFRVNMFDTEGKPITVCVSNRFVQERNNHQIFSVGEDGCYNWISILEKAVLKWIQVYSGQVYMISHYSAEMITPMFTGDGRSFCIQPGRLEGKDLSRVINTCLENGMMVNAVTDSHFLSLVNDEAVIHPLTGIRIISPGTAAKYFDKNAVKNKIPVIKSANSEELFPSNWRNTQTGDWEIGFFDEFAIYDCQFWNYKQKQQKNGKYTFVMENNGKEVKVNVGKQERNIRRIEIAGKKANYDIINTSTLPDYPTQDTRTGFVDNGYKMDTVTIVGWLKDLPAHEWEKNHEVEVSFENILKDEQENAFAKMDSLGRFVLKFPILNTSTVYFDWERTNVHTVLEPGQTYFLLSDYKTGQKLFMGKDVRLQNEILTYPLDRDFVRMEHDDTDFDKFIASTDSLLKKHIEKIQKFNEAHPLLSSRYIQYRKGDTFWRQAATFCHARFYNENHSFPDNARKYTFDTFWMNLEQPYTLYNNQWDFLKDFLWNEVELKRYSFNYIDFIEELANNEEERIALVRWREWFKKANEAIDQATTMEEKENIAKEENAKNADLIKEMMRIVKSPKANKIITGKSFFSQLGEELQKLDSVGGDSIIKDFLVTRKAWNRMNWDNQSLLPEVLDSLKKMITIPAGIEIIENKNNYYLALENREFDKLVLKSFDNLSDISEGETLLKKILEPYKGKFVLLDVWGTWCGPCKAALSHSQEEYERLKDYDIEYLYLATDSPKEAWENVIKEYNVTGDNVAHYNLPGEQQEAIQRYLNIHSWPSYRLFDRNGNLLDVNVDARDLEILAKLLDKLK